MLKLIIDLEVEVMLEKTYLFNAEDIEDSLICKTLDDVYDALLEKGYNPINQIVGYLISGDPGYISSYRDARSKITEFDRTKLLMTVLKGYLER